MRATPSTPEPTAGKFRLAPTARLPNSFAQSCRPRIHSEPKRLLLCDLPHASVHTQSATTTAPGPATFSITSRPRICGRLPRKKVLGERGVQRTRTKTVRWHFPTELLLLIVENKGLVLSLFKCALLVRFRISYTALCNIGRLWHNDATHSILPLFAALQQLQHRTITPSKKTDWRPACILRTITSCGSLESCRAKSAGKLIGVGGAGLGRDDLLSRVLHELPKSALKRENGDK